jgi:protein-L-isoaspartate(D-aspartate) O-methyltransferase
MSGTRADGSAADRAEERGALLREIQAEMRETAGWTGRAALSPRVAAALRRVSRHEFVPPESRDAAYANCPLPIGSGQTISQPFIVALMTELADVAPGDRVLEVGTGCGYQAAVLAELASRVYTIETVPRLAAEARDRLARLGYANVEVREGDGWAGWPEQSPFDAILVTAAARDVPPPLVAQLAPGGRLVLPVGDTPFSQHLMLVEKDAEGNVKERGVLPVAFVPLTRRPVASPGDS